MGELLLAVGFGAVDITPPVGLKMCGALEPRTSVGTTDPLMAKSFVATDGERRLAIVGVDIVGLPRTIMDPAIAEIAARTGLDPEAVIISCSHTHSGPYTSGPFFLDALDADYLGTLPDRIAASVEQAIAALQPASMHLGRSLVHNGPHHRLMLTKDGKALNSWMSEALNDLATSPQVVGASGPIDPELWVVRFDGRDGRTLGVFFNFSVHTNSHFGITWSADYPGVVAEFMRDTYGPDVITVFAPGACGNINSLYGGEQWRSAAELFAAAAVEAAQRAVLVAEPIRVDVLRRDVAVPKRDPATQPAGAIERLNWGGGLHYEEVFEPLLAFVAGMPDEWVTPVSAARLGPFAIATNPGELFVEYGLRLKQQSPFRHTVVAELANDWAWYMPTRAAFEQQVYEALVGPNQISLQGIETLVDTANDLLQALWRRGQV